jgi:hypothetical protein
MSLLRSYSLFILFALGVLVLYDCSRMVLFCTEVKSLQGSDKIPHGPRALIHLAQWLVCGPTVFRKIRDTNGKDLSLCVKSNRGLNVLPRGF